MHTNAHQRVRYKCAVHETKESQLANIYTFTYICKALHVQIHKRSKLKCKSSKAKPKFKVQFQHSSSKMKP